MEKATNIESKSGGQRIWRKGSERERHDLPKLQPLNKQPLSVIKCLELLLPTTHRLGSQISPGGAMAHDRSGRDAPGHGSRVPILDPRRQQYVDADIPFPPRRMFALLRSQPSILPRDHLASRAARQDRVAGGLYGVVIETHPPRRLRPVRQLGVASELMILARAVADALSRLMSDRDLLERCRETAMRFVACADRHELKTCGQL